MQIYDNTKFHIFQYGVLHKLFPSNLYNLIFSSAAAFRSVGSLPGRNTMRRLPLRSPPRVRGKDPPAAAMQGCPGITPACAGKSSRQPGAGRWRRDHPRVCGEKFTLSSSTAVSPGSPPRMRGKAPAQTLTGSASRITPACAGKSSTRAKTALTRRDHPRVCGEKRILKVYDFEFEGSPPRVRGKVVSSCVSPLTVGITPACAGKSLLGIACALSERDHPRVCGEKCSMSHCVLSLYGITPAYAGKRVMRRRSFAVLRDHPRVCGEKLRFRAVTGSQLGSPPRMRGKVYTRCCVCLPPRITPAYAGKSRAPTYHPYVT